MAKKLLRLESDIAEISGFSKRYAKFFPELGIKNVKDLLFSYPRYHRDLSQTVKIADLQIDETVTVVARLTEFKNIHLRSGRIHSMQKGVFTDESGSIDATWFNMTFLVNALKVGEEYIIVARLKRHPKTNRLFLSSPQFEKASDNPINAGRLVPVYSLTRGLSPKTYRRIVIQALESKEIFAELDKIDYPNTVYQKVPKKLISLTQSVSQIHFPDNFQTLNKAKFRLGVEELVQIKKMLQKKENSRQKSLPNLQIDEGRNYVDEFWALQKFDPTSDQKECCEYLLKNLSDSSHPIEALVQGDVGTGKTAIAAFLCYLALENGKDAVVFAPTTVLASQHQKSLAKMLPKAKVELVMGDSSLGKKAETAHKRKNRVIVSTQAILFRQKNLRLDLGMLIVDEEHRFGVEQRDSLKNLHGKNLQPHYVSLTATPIPRTLALAIFGDIVFYSIKDQPKGRLEKITYLVPENKREDSYSWIREQIAGGNQVFWLCPLITETKKTDGEEGVYVKPEKTTVEEQFNLLKKIFSKTPGLKLAKLHGRMKNAEKLAVLNDFRSGKTHILVCTSVIEVGVDIPDANIIVIENAEQFGLAQLHQLRGRVGRGKKQGYCLLFPKETSASFERLNFFKSTSDGEKLAEYDLKERGPGELYSKFQSGQLVIADILNPDQVRLANEIAAIT